MSGAVLGPELSSVQRSPALRGGLPPNLKASAVRTGRSSSGHPVVLPRYVITVSIWEREPEGVLSFQKTGNDIWV